MIFFIGLSFFGYWSIIYRLSEVMAALLIMPLAMHIAVFIAS